ncbi:hypothetical protein E4U13_000495, partial [Claviceps humidiphila]
MELSTKEVKYPIVTLKSYDDWNDFYENLEKLCRSLKYWDKVDPDLPDLDSDILVKPAVLTPDQSLDYILSKIQSRTGSSTAVTSATAENSDTTPSRPAMSVADAINLRQFMMAQENAEYNLRSPKEQQIQLWISACVESNAYNTITSKLTSGTGKSDFSLRQLVKALKKKFSPGDFILKASLSSQYKALLQDALRANTNPDRWLDEWATLYPRASRVKIPELEGPNAVREFLSAVGHRFEPAWAHSKDVEVTKYTDELPDDMSLPSLHDELRRFREGRRVKQGSVGIGVHATLGAQSDGVSQSTPHHDCPCGAPNHMWKPEACQTLRQAVTGEFNGYKSSLPQNRRTAMRQSYESPKWEALRASITANGWQSSKKRRWNKPKGKIPPNIAAAAIDPDLLHGVVAAEAQAIGIYTTLGDRRHILSESTVYDTGGAMHVVNSIDLLDPGTFKPAED